MVEFHANFTQKHGISRRNMVVHANFTQLHARAPSSVDKAVLKNMILEPTPAIRSSFRKLETLLAGQQMFQEKARTANVGWAVSKLHKYNLVIVATNL